MSCQTPKGVSAEAIQIGRRAQTSPGPTQHVNFDEFAHLEYGSSSDRQKNNALGTPPGTRTRNPLIKRCVLHRSNDWLSPTLRRFRVSASVRKCQPDQHIVLADRFGHLPFLGHSKVRSELFDGKDQKV